MPPWFRHCQTCSLALLLALIVGSGIALWKINQRGLAAQGSCQLSRFLSENGLHADFESARLSLSKGLVAKNLRIYSNPQKTLLLASADSLSLDIDRSGALRGDWEIRSAQFKNGFFRLPDNCAPHNLTKLQGTASLTRDKRFQLNNATGSLGQLKIKLNLLLDEAPLTDLFTKDPSQETSPLNDFISSLQKELSHWSAPDTWPPHLDLSLTGNLSQPQSIRSDFTFTASQITRQTYQMEDLKISGSLTPSSLRLHEFTFHDGSGPLNGSGYYPFRSRRAEFKAQSKVDLSRLLRTGLDIHTLDTLTFTRAPELTLQGHIDFPKNQKPAAHLTGNFHLNDFRFLGTPWSSLQSDFSFQNKSLFLRDLLVTHPEGQLAGQLLFQNENIRYRATSSLPVRLFKPFLKPDGDIIKTIAKADFRPDSQVLLKLNGTLRPSKLTEWAAAGTAQINNFSFNKVPIHHASCSFNFTPLSALYSNPEVEFDLTADESHRTFGGPDKAVVRAKEISYDYSEKVTRVDHLQGVCWPATVLNLFLPKTAAYLQETFRLTAPPSFSATGIIDHRPGRKRTSFLTRAQSEAPMLYEFLGQTVVLRNTSALIHSRDRQIDVTELSSYGFSGPINGEISVLLPNKEDREPDFRGKVRWTRLRLADIGQLYGFDSIEEGLVTGRFDFFGTAGNVKALNGEGNIALEQGELFKAPIFGPLSPLIAGFQGHQKASHETARDASANFLVRNGTLYTDDFITKTESLTVKAFGNIDLERKTLDMTAYADTKGLLGLVTIPLTPLKGLIQFRGTGPVAEPVWVNTPFSVQEDPNRQPLFPPPPKARVVEE
ncbi:MAG: AsmA-like C-terminal region-containing protein [Verrucomicrobiota bacterium]